MPSFGGTTALSLYSSLLIRSREAGSDQAWMFPAPHRWSTNTISVYTPGGALRASQVPGESSHTSALIMRPRPRHLATATSAKWCCPRWSDDEGHSNKVDFGADSQGFSTRCLRFQIRISLHWQDSLPVGGSPYRVGFEPTGLRWRISSRLRQPIYSNAPGFAWRH